MWLENLLVHNQIIIYLFSHSNTIKMMLLIIQAFLLTGFLLIVIFFITLIIHTELFMLFFLELFFQF